MNYVTGNIRLTLRIEGLCVLLGATYVYAIYDYSWLTFALLFLLPDLAFAGYLAGARIGAICYNSTHSYIGPIILWVLSSLTADNLLATSAIIWLAHIGFDRALGYGLKYEAGFSSTHLGPIGRGKK